MRSVQARRRMPVKNTKVKHNNRKPAPKEKPTTAIVPVEQPQESVVPTIKGTVANLERLRRFVSRCLNTDLQARLSRLAKENEGRPPDKQLQIEQQERERLEIDWGTIPGVDKPFLKQPGAEKFLLWLNLRPEYSKREIDMGGGHIEIVASVRVFHKKTKEIVFEGPDCSCSTMESNFRFRWAEVPKPDQDKCDELKASGMGRFRKKKIYARGRFTGEEWVWQQRVENPNIHDERNKVRQMGEKRALVKCIRNMGALSEIFISDPSEWDIPNDDDDPLNDQDFTASGRRIVNADGTAPSGRPVGRQYGSSRKVSEEGAKKIEDNKAYWQGVADTEERMKQAKSAPNEIPQKTAGEAAQVNDRTGAQASENARRNTAVSPAVPKSSSTAAMGATEQPKTVSDRVGSQPQTSGTGPQTPKQKIVTVTFPSESSEIAHVLGDIAQLVPWIQGNLGGIWSDRFKAWTIPVEKVPDLQAAVTNAGHRYQEIKPPARKEPPKETAGPTLKAGVVKDIRAGKTQKGQPDVKVLFDGTWYYSFRTTIFEFLEHAKGKSCILLIEGNPPKIVGIKRIGTREFDADGCTPIVSKDEPVSKGTANLFK